MCEQGSGDHETVEERELRQAGQLLHSVELPADEELDAAIARGISQAGTHRRRRTRMRAAAMAVCAMLIAGLVSVRFSPAVAAYVGQLPLLKPLVEMIQYDKGLKLAFENDFFQPVGSVQEQDGIKVTMEGLIADESRILLFLSIDNAPDSAHFLRNMMFRDQAGNPLEEVSIVFGETSSEVKEGRKRQQVDLLFAEAAALPDLLQMSFQLGGNDYQQPTSGPLWQLNIPIDKSKFAGTQQVYELGESLVIDGQKITFGKMTVYPTRIGVEVAYDPANSKRIFSLGNIRIENEQGEVFANGANGLIASLTDEDHAVLYFQSSYFVKSKRLYLKTEGIRGLDKSMVEVKIDLEQKRLLSAPDNRLSLFDVAQTDEHLVLNFHFKGLGAEEKKGMLFSWNFRDAEGVKHELHQVGSSQLHDNGKIVGEEQYFLPKGDYPGPLTMTLNDYPEQLAGGSFTIRIK
ncbi:MAG: hypothetical protein K0R57_6058 [Paenibacillaceae bacterium]|jgi:hypothetical protein|nr:hypothetical protein [Paenibacillaceae bacterium]